MRPSLLAQLISRTTNMSTTNSIPITIVGFKGTECGVVAVHILVRQYQQRKSQKLL